MDTDSRKLDYAFRICVYLCSSVGKYFSVFAFTRPPSSPFPDFLTTSHFQLPTPRLPTPIIQPAVKPGRADRRSLVNPRLCRIQASRPGNIEERAGHGGESILWLIRTSRERREVTAKGNRRAQLPVDLETFLRPEPEPTLAVCAG